MRQVTTIVDQAINYSQIFIARPVEVHTGPREVPEPPSAGYIKDRGQEIAVINIHPHMTPRRLRQQTESGNFDPVKFVQKAYRLLEPRR